MRWRDLFGRRSGVTGEGNGQNRPESDLLLFVDASLAMVNRELLEDVMVRDGLRLYLIGAAEALARRNRLGEADFHQLANRGLKAIGEHSPPDGFRAALSHSDRRFSRQAMVEGIDALEAWLDGDTNSPMRLTQLAVEWSRLPQSHQS